MKLFLHCDLDHRSSIRKNTVRKVADKGYPMDLISFQLKDCHGQSKQRVQSTISTPNGFFTAPNGSLPAPNEIWAKTRNYTQGTKLIFYVYQVVLEFPDKSLTKPQRWTDVKLSDYGILLHRTFINCNNYSESTFKAVMEAKNLIGFKYPKLRFYWKSNPFF
jgi:hypothetical protein